MGQLTTTNQGGALAHLDLETVEDVFGGLSQGVGDGGNYGKFNGNTGDYTWGQTDDLIEHGSQVLVDYSTAFLGWLCWMDGKVEDRETVNVFDGKPPLEKDLPDHGPYNSSDDGWGPTCGFKLFLEDGTEITLNLNSRSGDIAFRRLLGDIGKGARKNPGKLPVVEIGAAAFENKKSRGKKYAPTFEIVAWETPDEYLGTSRGENPDDYENDEQSGDDGDGGIPTNEDAKTATARKASAAKEDTPPPATRRRREEPSAEREEEGPTDEKPKRRRRKV
ncbi:hypothetical protein [Candidatus Macondimonas diazotrophica]|jgi:hypothetical protein|uniref:Uncharacterized protein n=1 Tax=Candidatus Macondimonas diazotrophica TaxID=2305248 RepID=A0A4Z0F644_9GAMM|nr:hypothetical protein [Candidatus Macondimonas diazotrophica]TFZ81642.1 hypothetical protein E4680_11710 [Candidatus Macondimonas diazotrophica]